MPLSYFRAPLYFYFLAGIYKLFGISITVARLVQLVLGAINCFLLFWFALKVFKKESLALAAGLVMAFYGPIIYFDGELLLPVVIIFFDLIFWLVFYTALTEKQDPKWWFIAGLVLGLSAITRPNVLVFLPIIIIWSYLKHRTLSTTLKVSLLSILGTCLVIAPVTIRNYVVEKDFVLVASQGGVCLHIGNNLMSDGGQAILPGGRATWEGGYIDAIRMAEKGTGRRLKSSEVSAYWTSQVFSYIRNNPKHWLKLMLRKTIHYWHGEEIGNNKNLYFTASQSKILSMLMGSGIIWYPLGVLAPLAWCGMVFIGGFRRREYLWITLFIISYAFSFIVFYNCARYRIPVIPLLILYGVAFVFWVIDQFRSPDWKKLLLAGLLFSILMALFNYRPYESGVLNFSQSYNHLGNMYQRTGDDNNAAKSYQKGIEVDPYRDESYYNLALLSYNSKKYKEARNYQVRALMLRPDLSDNQLLMGLILKADGQNKLAEEYFLMTLEINSYEEKAYINLGEI